MLAHMDKEMILKTIFRSGAEKVCLVFPEPKKSYRRQSDLIVRKVGEKLLKKIEEFTEVDIISFKFNDYNEVMERTIEYIKKNKDKYDIIINISVGSHFVCAILQNIASIFNLKVQFTFMTELNSELLSEKDWHYGFEKVIELPTIPTNVNLSKKEKDFLVLLDKKDSMIVQDYISLFNKNDDNKKRAEFNYYVDKFRRMNIISIKKVANRNIISLTKTGKLILSI